MRALPVLDVAWMRPSRVRQWHGDDALRRVREWTKNALVNLAEMRKGQPAVMDPGYYFREYENLRHFPDVALVDLYLEDGDASPLVQILSERGVAVVIATGSDVSQGQPAFRTATDVLQKPYSVRDLINALMKCAPAARPLQSNSEFCWTGDGKTS